MHPRGLAECEQRVAASIAHHQRGHQAKSASSASIGQTTAPIHSRYAVDYDYQPSAATQRQIQALYGMTVRHRLDLRRLLYDRFRKRHLYDLTRSEAGCLIGELQKLQCPARAEQTSR
jgi:hypothetical protein